MTFLIGHRIDEQRADRVQRVEPASRLIHRLADVVGRELGFETILVLERVMPLCKGHGAGVEPDVDQVLDAPHGSAALGTRVCHLVDVRPMQVEVLQIAADLLPQLGDRANTLAVPALLAFPDRQAACPSSAPG